MLRAISGVVVCRSSGEALLAGPSYGRVFGWTFVQTRNRRRTTNPPPWIPPKEENVMEFIEQDTKDLLRQVTELEKQGALPGWARAVKSPLRQPPWEVGDGQRPLWNAESSRRVGLLARKIGMLPQWLSDGTRVLCTMLEFPENQVVSAIDPDTWYRTSIVGKRKAFGTAGAMWRVTVGAVNTDPSKFTEVYRRSFIRQGVPVKEHLGCFMVSEDAVVHSGTPLHVCHFTVGQHVAVTGKTIDYGFQGVMRRWGMRGNHGTSPTKSHRRVGAIGSTGDARVWPGRRLPGHMGYEWVTTSGLEVLRINPNKQVMYIKGCVPGEIGDIVHVKDCRQVFKRVQNPPFPTYYPHLDAEKPTEKEAEAVDEEGASLAPFVASSGEIFAAKLFRFSSPSIVFTEKDETRVAARDKTRAKTAKVKK